MNLSERIRQLVSALPSDDSAVTFTRADLAALVDGAEVNPPPQHVPDLTVEEVASEVGRAPSTVRGWLIAGELRGYKLNRRDWRVPRSALRDYLAAQTEGRAEVNDHGDEAVDIGAWRMELE